MTKVSASIKKAQRGSAKALLKKAILYVKLATVQLDVSDDESDESGDDDDDESNESGDDDESSDDKDAEIVMYIARLNAKAVVDGFHMRGKKFPRREGIGITVDELREHIFWQHVRRSCIIGTPKHTWIPSVCAILDAGMPGWRM